MDQEILAAILVTANESEQQVLLTEHVELADANLAWALQSLYDNVESSNPAHAARPPEWSGGRTEVQRRARS